MFFFYHTKQDASNADYYKGILFERLLGEYIEALGYAVEIRRKQNSLEYDLVGNALVDGRALVGEAKAYSKSIAAEKITSFAGKLLIPQIDHPHVFGLFLSTSSLTAEAEDYVRRLKQSPNGPQIRSLSGDQLLRDIQHTLKLPTSHAVAESVRKAGAFPLATHLLMTDHGPFLLETAAAADGATQTHFCVVRRDGALVNDVAFIAALQDAVAELSDLAPVTGTSIDSAGQPRRREVSERLLLGRDWADYRLPAPPEFFVGRRDFARGIVDTIYGDSHSGVIQIKSRSGVGKSSLIAFLADRLEQRGARVQVYDARNVKSVLDVWSVVQRFSGAAVPPADYSEMERQLDAIASATTERSVLLIDQFESTFSVPDLFDAVEFLALAIAERRPHLAIVFARKNDLQTTYDGLGISLSRLNGLSTQLLLEDFNAPEAVELIENISRQSKKPIASTVKHYVLEFAQGFPWLLKRTMAHVLKLSQQAEGRANLLSTTLRLNDLFDEELEGLDELERGYLTRIAHRLPATYQQMERAFDEDPNLPQVIRKLTETRLLRLSGVTYDTYNDVFKEYLVDHRLPEFRVAHIYKLSPTNVLAAFAKLSPLGRFSNEDMSRHLKVARGSTFNLVHELRALDLVDREGKHWVIPDLVNTALQHDRLGEYVRQQLMQNAVVSDFVSHLQSGSSLLVSELPDYLAKRLPFVQASPSTWTSYASVMLAWLNAVHLATVRDGAIYASQLDRSEAVRRMGNLRLRSRGKRVAASVFVPSSRLPAAIEAAHRIWKHGAVGQGRAAMRAARDLMDLGLLGTDGRMIVADEAQLIQTVRSLLTQPPYDEFWAAAGSSSDLFPILRGPLGLEGLSATTLSSYAKVLGSWGRSLGLLPSNHKTLPRGRKVVVSQRQLLLDSTA